MLEIGVSLLTENYRRPFKSLLDNSTDFLKKEISETLEFTLKPYPKFQDLVIDIMLGELEESKVKAEEYLNIQIDIHKRFINSEHVEFRKLNKVMKKDGIRFKNNFNLWFRENIPTAEDNGTVDTTDNDSGIMENVAAEGIEVIEGIATDLIAPPVKSNIVNAGIKMVRGFVDRLQKKDQAQDVHTNKLPTQGEEEAMLHLDLCIDYMEIIDKALVDEIPKIFIMMLVHKTLDFLGGGESYKTSLLREVQKQCRSPEVKADILIKSYSHEEMISELKERKRVCEETIKVINETSEQLNKCT